MASCATHKLSELEPLVITHFEARVGFNPDDERLRAWHYENAKRTLVLLYHIRLRKCYLINIYCIYIHDTSRKCNLNHHYRSTGFSPGYPQDIPQDIPRVCSIHPLPAGYPRIG